MIVVTNIFRDQLDRYGEVMHTLEAIREGIRLAPEAVLCLNADDSLVASLALDVPNPVIWFGIEETAVQERQDAVNTVDNGDRRRFFVSAGEETKNRPLSPDSPDKISDARYCIRCGAEYIYRYHTYAHLGDFQCPCCGYARPLPDAAVTSIDGIDAGGSRIHVRIRGREGDIQELPVRIALPAVYNIYNAAAALTTYTASKLPRQERRSGQYRDRQQDRGSGDNRESRPGGEK